MLYSSTVALDRPTKPTSLCLRIGDESGTNMLPDPAHRDRAPDAAWHGKIHLPVKLKIVPAALGAKPESSNRIL